MKQYVIRSFDRYWLMNREDEISEVHDLMFATTFKRKKDAQAVIDSISIGEYCEIVELTDDLVRANDEWISQGMIRRTIPKFTSTKYNGEGVEEVIKFYRFHIQNEAKVAYEDYKTWPIVGDFLDNFYDCVFFRDEDGNSSGSVQIKVERDKSTFEDFEDELEIVKPFVDRVTELDGKEYKIFPIFDHELSCHETRNLLYHDHNDCKISGRFDRHHLSGTLEECYNLIKRSFYYE